jgi:membrane associated rhomboid family serine protease
MIILPVGLEENQVRRAPWVSAILIGSCFFVQLVLSTFFSGRTHETDERLGQAVEYLVARPYLSAPPELAALLGDEARAHLQEARLEMPEAELVPHVVAAEQEQLNELTREAFDLVRRLPSHRFGFIPAAPGPFTLLSYAFLHGGWLHLLGNMLFLFLSGPFIEDLYGRPLFTGLYVVAAIVGAGAYAVEAPQSAVPLVGASGAIAGVMGAFLWRLSRRRIRFLVLPIPIIPAFRFNLVLPAFVVLPLWALEQAYYTLAAGSDSPVAFAAHVGGFVAGLVFALVVALLRIEETVVAPAIEREISLEQDPRIERASEARLAGDLAAARREIRAALQAAPDNLDALIEAWEIALGAGDGPEAGRVGVRLLELLGRQDEQELLWDVAGDPRWREMSMPSRFVFQVAGLYARHGDGRQAVELYQLVAAQNPPDDVAVLRALVSEGETLARAGDASSARRVFDRARAHPQCSGPWIERIEGALRVTATTRGASRPRPG